MIRDVQEGLSQGLLNILSSFFDSLRWGGVFIKLALFEIGIIEWEHR